MFNHKRIARLEKQVEQLRFDALVWNLYGGYSPLKGEEVIRMIRQLHEYLGVEERCSPASCRLVKISPPASQPKT